MPSSPTYTSIRSILEQGQLQQALEAIGQVDGYEERVLGLLGRLSRLDQEEDEQGTNELRRVTRNRIQRSAIRLLMELKPLEDLETEAKEAHSTDRQGEYWRILKEADDAYLTTDYFIGREQTIEICLNQLDTYKRALAIIGLAGNGKTSICHQIINRWLSSESGRVVYVLEVEFLSSYQALLNGLAEMAGLDTSKGVPTEQAILAQLDELPAGLLYLDNIESAIDEAGHTQMLLRKLSGLNSLKVIGSSRRAIPAWSEMDLDVLEDEDAVALFHNMWLEKAGWSRVVPDQELIHQFVTQDLSCHPLSISIVASHARSFINLEELVEWFRGHSCELSQRFASSGTHRLDSLNYSLGLSIERLQDQPQARLLLALCAIFRHGLSPTLQKVLVANGAFDLRDRASLIERSLADFSDQGYLRLLPPVVRFVRVILNDNADDRMNPEALFNTIHLVALDERSTTIDEHLDYVSYFASLNYTNPKLYDLPFKWMNRYHQRLFRARGILKTLSERSDLPSHHKQHANIKMYLGQLVQRSLDPDLARSYYQEALLLYQEADLPMGEAHIESHLGELEFISGTKDIARKHYNRALSLYSDLDLDRGKARIYDNLGRLEMRAARIDEARQYYQKALEIHQAKAGVTGQANALANLGRLELYYGDRSEARKYYLQALSLYQQQNSATGVAYMYRNLGQLEAKSDQPEKARQHFKLAMDYSKQAGDLLGLANTYFYSALLEQKIGDLLKAKANWLNALDGYRKVKYIEYIANTLLYLTETQLDIDGKVSEINAWLQEAETLIETNNLDAYREECDRLAKLVNA
ncbi:MAG: tetratricopeptide repeat protein [Bacteroidota bacterium]